MRVISSTITLLKVFYIDLSVILIFQKEIPVTVHNVILDLVRAINYNCLFCMYLRKTICIHIKKNFLLMACLKS